MATDTGGKGVLNHCTDQPTASQLDLLERIADLIGSQVHIEQIGYEGDPDWIKFRVAGSADPYVLLKLEANQHELFHGQEIRNWQILGASNHPRGGGLWLHELTNAKTPTSHCGVWFY
jgi:hypothetical protein